MNKDRFLSPRMERGVLACVNGFTLFELLTTLSIFSVLSIIAIPSFSAFISTAQLSTDHQKLQSLLSLARMSAVSEGNFAVVCRWDGASGCTGFSALGTLPWATGGLVFSDSNNNRQLDLPDDRVLRIVEFSTKNQITWNRGELLVYESDGSVRGGSNGTFTITQGDEVRKLVVSLTGRVRRGS